MGWKQIQRALDAGRHSRVDDPGIALEALGPAVHDRDEAGLVHGAVVVVADEGEDHAVDPAAGHDRVQAADDHGEAAVKVFVQILDLAVVGPHLDAGDPLGDEGGRYLGLMWRKKYIQWDDRIIGQLIKKLIKKLFIYEKTLLNRTLKKIVTVIPYYTVIFLFFFKVENWKHRK